MQESKRAIITGINGQDGSYLAETLLDKGYEVWGTVKEIRLQRIKPQGWTQPMIESNIIFSM